MRTAASIIVCLSCLGQAACSAGRPARPAGMGPFMASGSASPPADLESAALLAAGIALGLLAAYAWRKLREPGGGEGGSRLKDALEILEDALAAGQRAGKLVRLKDWLRKKG